MVIRSRQPSALVIAAVVAAAGLFTVATLVGGVVLLRAVRTQTPGQGAVGRAVSSVAGPSAGREGETWTFQDLADSLRTHGITCVTQPSPLGSMVMIFGADKEEVIHEWATQDTERRPYFLFPDLVLVEKVGSAEVARDIAGKYPRDQAFSWGRFVFRTGVDGKTYLKRFRDALP